MIGRSSDTAQCDWLKGSQLAKGIFPCMFWLKPTIRVATFDARYSPYIEYFNPPPPLDLAEKKSDNN